MLFRLVCVRDQCDQKRSGSGTWWLLDIDAYDVQQEGGVERSGEREVLMVLVGHGDVALRLVQGLRRELVECDALDRGVYGWERALTLENSSEKALGSAITTLVLSSRDGMMVVSIRLQVLATSDSEARR